MTRVFGVLGHPIGHSLSPLMHNAAFAARRLDGIYAPFDVPPAVFAEVVRGLVACGISGFNVTVPHKETIVPLLDTLVRDARALGAVNAVVAHRGRLTGHNTDTIGLMGALAELGWRPRRCTAMILGAGGSAKAVAWVLTRAPGTHVIVANRRLDRAQRLAEWLRPLRPRCRIEVRPLEPVDVRGCDLLVNATPIGMAHDADIPLIRGLGSRVMVYDLVYNRTTALVRRARRQGCVAANGVSMLVYQGAASFEWWWHRRAPIAAMRRAVERALRYNS
ncbi:MAG TPA: shikimate dehydrogenase [Candidatus Omnitrophica bacterium]|nr:MAG: shikimate dehydrogenase [Omnitrophica WOR_2 bacterium GWA2_63_20]OGX32261.1 MAG: shikimate dehydrogenase [Omnitrophica WOR_2 bacterium RIFCSPHIGHO2_12_FULL_64_13]OGX36425.1 MAG: shikimate dehydrogenase [Omnitrophica WOR_2 bacterium RIFCSPHIGHO2_02_FULL_63_39]OGX45419.1 MAG: shikimate dehydrogenase [Omnitrophica WOR_2 bacterium RIFCSPLOWO2_02_FULL_63_16]HBH96750.1 shikimate dehydrogenase [Candidatus Omnitrophota bacterium]